jgi:hypothetical protein
MGAKTNIEDTIVHFEKRDISGKKSKTKKRFFKRAVRFLLSLFKRHD